MKTISITIPDNIHSQLISAIPKRGLSKFISQCLEKELKKSADELYQAYHAASQEAQREEEALEWGELDVDK